MNLISATVSAVSFLTFAIVAAVLTTSSASTLIDFNSSMLGLLLFWLTVSMCCESTALCIASSGSRSSGLSSSVACKNFSAKAPRNDFEYLPCIKCVLSGPLGVAPPCNLHRFFPFKGGSLHVPPLRVFAPHAFMGYLLFRLSHGVALVRVLPSAQSALAAHLVQCLPLHEIMLLEICIKVDNNFRQSLQLIHQLIFDQLASL